MKAFTQPLSKGLITFGCFLLTFASGAFAQGDPGTDDDGFIVEIVSPPGIAQLLQNSFTDCGWFGSSYGPSLTEELCGEVVWAMPDSLACGPLPPGSLTDKIALIRRGDCSFSLKVYHAQEAGAKAVIIVNHYNNSLDGPCFARVDASTYLGGMLGVDSADAVNIPSIFIQRQTGEQIAGALDAGETVEVCFGFPSMLFATTAYHYATPVSQVDTLDHIGVVFVNREPNTIFDVGLTAVVEEPDGNMVTLTRTVDSAETGVDNLIYFFPAYVPPAVPGKFKVTYSNDVYTSGRDSVVAFFEHTDYTYASDNLALEPGGISNDATFAAANFFTQYGALCLTNESGAVATYVTLGLANAADLHIPNPFGAENDLQIFLYDADIDDDGVWEFTTSSNSFDDMAAGLVGYAIYPVNGTEGVDDLFSVQLDDLNNPGTFAVNLKPNHPYFISIAYDGVPAGTGIMPRYSNTTDQNYADFPTTRLLLDQMYSGWNGAEQVLRLQLEGFDPNFVNVTAPSLDVDIQLLPNPAIDLLRVNLDFGEITSAATVTLMNGLGQSVRSERLSNFRDGQLTFDVRDLASGTYILSVRNSEGVAIRKVAVCH